MSLKEDVEEVQNNIKEVSLAFGILGDYKKSNENIEKVNKRLSTILMITILLWFISVGCLTGYIIYLLNDIGTEEITETTYDTNTQEIDNDGSIDNSYIINGDNYGKN